MEKLVAKHKITEKVINLSLYRWYNRMFWKSWIKKDLKKIYYKYIHKFKVTGDNKILIPKTGKGEFVSVYTKGEIIQIINEDEDLDLKFDEIKIIPYQPNHGIMIERYKNNKLIDRNTLGIEDICEF
jgi:hypothetical protein